MDLRFRFGLTSLILLLLHCVSTLVGCGRQDPASFEQATVQPELPVARTPVEDSAVSSEDVSERLDEKLSRLVIQRTELQAELQHVERVWQESGRREALMLLVGNSVR